MNYLRHSIIGLCLGFASSASLATELNEMQAGNFLLANPYTTVAEVSPSSYRPRRVLLNPRVHMQVANYNKLLLSQMALFPSHSSGHISSKLERFSNPQSGQKFYLVRNQAELNQFCARFGDKSFILPNHENVSAVACTSGLETYLVEAAMTGQQLHTQALVLIHEALSTIENRLGGRNFSAGARVTRGLGLLVELFLEQRQENFRQLRVSDVQRLQDLYEAYFEIAYQDSSPGVELFNWSIHPKGGGLVWNGARVAPSAVIGLSSLISSESIIGEEALIVRFKGEGGDGASLEIAPRAQLRDVTLSTEYNVLGVPTKLSVGENTVISSSKLTTQEMIIGENNVISNSQLKSHEMVVGSNNVFITSSISGGRVVLENDIKLEKVTLDLSGVKEPIQSNQRLKNATIATNAHKEYAPEGRALIPTFSIALNDVPTPCFKMKINDVVKADSYEFRNLHCAWKVYSGGKKPESLNLFFVPTPGDYHEVPHSRGMTVKFDAKYEAKAVKERRSFEKLAVILRSYSVSFNFDTSVQPVAPANAYMVLDGRFLKAGISRKMELRTFRANDYNLGHMERFLADASGEFSKRGITTAKSPRRTNGNGNIEVTEFFVPYQ